MHNSYDNIFIAPNNLFAFKIPGKWYVQPYLSSLWKCCKAGIISGHSWSAQIAKRTEPGPKVLQVYQTAKLQNSTSQKLASAGPEKLQEGRIPPFIFPHHEKVFKL